MWTAKKLRKQFIDFYKKKNHIEIDSASLIPENDPTCLFTTAGMHPLVPFLLGEKHPSGRRLVNVQKCLRTDDIHLVGDDTHNTFFEMLGSWSLGDYFKQEAITMSWEFLTKVLKLDKNKLAISCYSGNVKQNIPRDEESAQIWQSLGVKKDRIAFLSDNWWGPAGETGPCGPDTEMFYWNSEDIPPEKFDPQDARWVEIWNDVLMQYNKQIKSNNSQSSGTQYQYVPLLQKNIDTGMGLERTLAVLQNKQSIFQTELFSPIIKLIDSMIAKQQDNLSCDKEKNTRIIADHIRASVFLIADGVLPSNIDQGYVLRKLIRRIIRCANLILIRDEDYLQKLSAKVIENYKDTYPEIDKPEMIFRILKEEGNKFENCLIKGQKEFSKLVNNIKSHDGQKISGRIAFKLYESYGLPIEMIEEMAREENLSVDVKDFDKSFQRHQLISRKGAEGKFKGGLADNTKIVTCYHTATHLLHRALRMVLGDDVFQKGSNITSKRIRFDFAYPQKMSEEQKQQVEDLVNMQIKQSLPVIMQEMDLKSAKSSGALGFFESKYGKVVKVYTIGNSSRDYFSREICGGPHVSNTKELGEFKIISEKSSSAGIRRIKAILINNT